MASTTSTPGSAPKAMSSRLLTMKFMQRAAATPTSPSPATPDEPPKKRRKKDGDSSPPAFDVNALANKMAVQKALTEEEVTRQAALERQGAEAGDTRWVLNFEDERLPLHSNTATLQIVQTGFANLDSLSPSQIRSLDEEDSHDKPLVVGRRSFGKFNRVLERQQDPSLEDSSDSEDEEDESSSQSDDSANGSSNPIDDLIKAPRAEAAQRIKAERKARKKAEKKKGEELAKQRKKKVVNINGISSLSGDGEKTFTPTKSCYICGGPHKKADCPEKGKKRHRGGGGGGGSRPKKSQRTR